MRTRRASDPQFPAETRPRQQQSQERAGLVVDALFRAYFEEARDIGDAAVLAEIAAACGVGQWPDGANAARVQELEEGVRDLGVSAVPIFIFGRKSGLWGAYPPDQLAAAIRHAAAESVSK